MNDYQSCVMACSTNRSPQTRAIEAQQQSKERGLSTARNTHDGSDPAFRNDHVDVFQHILLCGSGIFENELMKCEGPLGWELMVFVFGIIVVLFLSVNLLHALKAELSILGAVDQAGQLTDGRSQAPESWPLCG